MFQKKVFKIGIIFALAMSWSKLSSAADMQLEFGMRQQSGEATTPGFSTSSEMGIQFGAVALFQMTPKIFIRSGGLYTQRPITISGQYESKIGLNYLDIPLTVYYKIADYGGVFGGLNFVTYFDGNCSQSGQGGGTTCTKPHTKSPLMPLVIGGMFKFAPQFGGSVYFETMSGEVAAGLSNYKAFGANVFITFD